MQLVPTSLVLLASSPLVAAHFKIFEAVGDLGGKSPALGVVDTIGTDKPDDVTHFKRTDDKTGKTNFGTLCGPNGVSSGGEVDPAKEFLALQKRNAGMVVPQVSKGGTLSMIGRQLNGDGAGPFNCTVSTDATGLGVFVKATTTLDVPGSGGISPAYKKDFPLKIKMPDVACTGEIGGVKPVCIVQCANAIQFGGNVVVQMGGAGGAKPAAAPAAASVVRRMANRFRRW